jgi:hypothetical protein
VKLGIRSAATGLLTAGLLGTALTGTASAAPAQAPGQVVLSTATGASVLVSYSTCASPTVRLLRLDVRTFVNQPLPGCQAALVNQAGSELPLCAGRGVVPPTFGQTSRLVIREGLTPPCGVAA